MLITPVFYTISAVVLFFHSFLNFYLCNALSEKTRFHKSSIYFVCSINSVVVPFLLTYDFSFQSLSYLLCIIALVLEYSLLFEGSFSSKLGIALGSLLHLFVLRAIIICSVAMYNGTSLYNVIITPSVFMWVNFSSFAAQLITLTLFITLIPLKTVIKIMSNKRFYTKLLFLTSLLILYMIFNTNIFMIDYFSVNLFVQEIVIAVLVLTIFYIMILLLINIFKLGIYKDKTKELEIKIDKDKTLASAVFNYANIIMEVNCSRDKIERLLMTSTEISVDHLPGLSHFFKKHIELYVHPEDKNILAEIDSFSIISEFEDGISEIEHEYRAKKLKPSVSQKGVQVVSDEFLWYKMRIKTSNDTSNAEVISVITVDEIHEEKEEALKLRLKAETDQLTGSYNKNTFAEKVNTYLKNERMGALFMFDLDNFKGINDNMGHSAGDAVLQEVATKTKTLFRNRDIVGRIGGDEFVVFLEGTTEKDLIEEKAKKLCSIICKKYYAKNKEIIEISCSIGIAIAPHDGTDFDTLFDVADLAMYQSKSEGKNCFTIYDSNVISGFTPQDKESYMRTNRVVFEDNKE